MFSINDTFFLVRADQGKEMYLQSLCESSEAAAISSIATF